CYIIQGCDLDAKNSDVRNPGGCLGLGGARGGQDATTQGPEECSSVHGGLFAWPYPLGGTGRDGQRASGRPTSPARLRPLSASRYPLCPDLEVPFNSSNGFLGSLV